MFVFGAGEYVEDSSKHGRGLGASKWVIHRDRVSGLRLRHPEPDLPLAAPQPHIACVRYDQEFWALRPAWHIPKPAPDIGQRSVQERGDCTIAMIHKRRASSAMVSTRVQSAKEYPPRWPTATPEQRYSAPWSAACEIQNSKQAVGDVI